jgi:glycosyltransferase involved in cell wall biosynthesis
MATTLCSLLPKQRLPVRVIPNWADCERLVPQDCDNIFRRRHGLQGKFVVMHAGNIGLTQDLELLVDVAWYLHAIKDVVMVIVGDGVRREWLAHAIRERALQNVLLLPYQPRDQLAHTLSAADMHWLALRPGTDGLMFPSKIYGIMAVGRPCLASAPPNSELLDFVQRMRIGVTSPNVAKAASEQIKWLRERPATAAALAERARTLISQQYAKPVIMRMYKEWLE